MHRVVRSHLEIFATDFSISGNESKQFEAFSAYCLAKKFTFESINPEHLVYEGSDPGIDSVFFIVNESLISTKEEVEDVFLKRRGNNDVKIVFIQSKTSESWQKAAVDTLSAATLDFVSDQPQHQYAEYIRERRDIFEVIIKNLGRVQNGRPEVYCYYVSTAGKLEDAEVLAAISAFKNRLSETGLFNIVDVQPIDRDILIKIWTDTKGSYEAQISFIGAASFPRSKGIEESYVVTVSAKKFVDHVLRDDRGTLRRSIFEENVRDFINFDDSEINREIQKSLTDTSSASRFGILNNGITIVSPDVRIQSNELYIRDYQIVNGCQTSNVLFESNESIPEESTLMVKVIETSDQPIIDEIVRSTNKQNKIEDHQFVATMESVKKIERYFRVRGDEDENKLYFERRPNQYSRDQVRPIRIFDLKEMARCCGAMFFDRPDLSSRYPNQLIDDLKLSVFDEKNREEIFYTAAFAHYRLKLHLGNGRIDRIFQTMRWYALMAAKYYVCGKGVANVKSDKIDRQCERINEFFALNDADSMKKWEEIASVFKSLGEVDRDRLRTSRFVNEVRDAMLNIK